MTNQVRRGQAEFFGKIGFGLAGFMAAKDLNLGVEGVLFPRWFAHKTKSAM